MSCCKLTKDNTELPGSSKSPVVVRRGYVHSTFDSQGLLNVWPVSTVIDDAFIQARLNDVDPFTRWYPTPLLDQVQQPLADDTVETTELGDPFFVSPGSRTFIGEHMATPINYAAVWDGALCDEVSVIWVDNCDNAQVELFDECQNYAGLQIVRNTFRARYIEPTGTTVAKTQFTWTYSRNIVGKNRHVILAESITAKLLSVKGLVQGVSVVVSSTVNEMLFSLKTLVDQIPVEGLLLPGIAVEELSPTPGASAGVLTEPTPGDYVYTYTVPQSSADLMQGAVTLTGFSFEAFTALVP